ncbi:hypothetical protein F4679DRAFT_393853 [Xylaria curta]|nr:hypothetical protein F4679DRAFT_393853 [Xylaria curta]
MSDLDFSHLSMDDLRKALEGPALSPPEGVSPNFEHPPNQNSVAVLGLLVCLVLASVFLIIRIYVKFFKIKRLHIGDYLIILAYPFYLANVVGSLMRTNTTIALFVHQWNVRGQDIEDYLFHIFIAIDFWAAAMLLVESSILLEWLRIFAPTGNRLFVLSCKILLVATILFYTAALVVFNLSCRPFKRIWDKTLEGSCTDIKRIHLGVVIVNIVLDLVILILPQPVIWNLQMTRLRKTGVSTIFTIGVLAVIAAGFLIDAVVSWTNTGDMTYYYSSVALWGIAETTCGILVFCVPFAPRLYQDINFSDWFGSLKRTKWLQESNGERQSRPRASKQRDYQEIDEMGGIRLREFGSPRPTDRQYGISVTTDIVVTESYEPDHVESEGSQHL